MVRQQTGFALKSLLGWTALTLLILATALGIAWYHASTRDYYFKEIKHLTREMAGYDLLKSEPLSFSLFPRPALTAKSLRIANPGMDEHALIAELGEISVFVHWDALFRLQLDLDVAVIAPRLTLVVNPAGTRNWMTPELEEITGAMPFDLVRVDTTETELLFSNHKTNELLGLDIHQFDIDLRQGAGNASIETAGRLGKSRFFLLGEITQRATDNRFVIDLDFGAGKARETRIDAINAPSVSWWIRQNAVLFPLQGAIHGDLAFEQLLPSGELEFDLATAKLNEFLHLSSALPTIKSDIGPLRANGRAVLRGSDIDITNLDAQIVQPEISLQLTGNVSNLLSDLESELVLSARSSDLNSIIDLTGLVPVVGEQLAQFPVETVFDASIKTRGKSLAFEDVSTTMRQEGLSGRLSGRMSLLQDDLEFQADLQVEAQDSSELTRILDIEKPDHMEPGPMKISASVSGTEKLLKIQDARADLHAGYYKAVLSGSVDLSGETPLLDLRPRLDIADMVGVRQYLRELPDALVDKLSVSTQAHLEGPANDFSLLDLQITSTRDDKKLIVNGEVSGLPKNPEVNVSFHYSLQDVIDLDDYFPKLGPQRIVGPLKLEGTAEYADKRLVVDGLSLKADHTDVGGLIDIDFSSSPPRAFIIMDAQEFQTKLIVTEPGDAEQDTLTTAGEEQEKADEAPAEQAPTSSPEQSPGELFQEFTNGIEINTKWVNDLDLYLSFTAEQAKLGNYDIEGLDVIIDARGGVFSVANYEITLQGRPMSLQGYVNVNTDPPTYLFGGKMEGETIEALLNLEEQVFEGGELSGEFVLVSEGDTLGEFIRHLDGRALLNMGPLVIRSKALSLVSSDILHSMLGGITRSEEKRRSTRYQCGVLGVDVKRGIALINKTFALEARDYNLAGKGKIDLNTGYVELAARPKAKKGLGISLSSLIGGFKVEGHIATPKFGVSGGGLVSAAVLGYAMTPTIAAAAANPATATIVATGFFAKGIFDRLTASSYSCKKTLQRIETNRRRALNPRNPHSGKMSF